MNLYKIKKISLFCSPSSSVLKKFVESLCNILSSFKGSCLMLQGGAGGVYSSSWVWTWLDVEPVSPFPAALNSLVNKFLLMCADCSEHCSTTKPQGYSWGLLRDQAPSIYVADPSGLVSGYFWMGDRRCLSAALDSGWVISPGVDVFKTGAAAVLGLTCVIY